MNDETIQSVSKAVSAGAQTLDNAVTTAGKLARYFDGALQELGGIAEENMKFRRYKNRLRLYDKAAKILQERGLDGPTREIPAKFVLPFVTYATLEEDGELQEVWAQLLANAADETSEVEVRTAFVDVLKDLTPSDVKILSVIGQLSDSDFPALVPPAIETGHLPNHAQVHTNLTTLLADPPEAVKLSLSNLSRVECITIAVGFGGVPAPTLVYITPMGLGLYRACTKRRESKPTPARSQT